MVLPRVPYCTREQLKEASDTKNTSNRNVQLDRAICSAADRIDSLTRRKFWPQQAVKYFDWPGGQYSRSWRLWLDEHEVITVDSIVLRGPGTTLDSSTYFLEPINSGPPFHRIEIDVSSGGGASSSFGGSSGTQRALIITGLWGYWDTRDSVGALGADISGSEASTAVRIDDSSLVGVGSLLLCESERMLVTEKTYIDSGFTLDASTTAVSNANSLTFDGSDAVSAGEFIMIGSEIMRVTETSGVTVYVKRAQEGSVLAAHSSGATVYVPRLCTVVRAAAGTTAAGHTSGTALYVQRIPALIQQLAVAEAMNLVAQEVTSYSRKIGEDDNTYELTGAGLEGLRAAARFEFGRNARIQVV